MEKNNVSYIYTPTRDYPKEPRIDLSKDEKESFDINDREQVAELTGSMLEEIYRGYKTKPNNDELAISGQLIENMLQNQDNFDACWDLDGRPFREIAMKYVRENFKKAQKIHERTCEGIKADKLG